MKFFIDSIGCARRDFEAQKVCDYLRFHGYTTVKSVAEADLVVIGTCAFISKKQEQSLRLIKDCRLNGRKMLVIGCLSGISPDVVSEFPDITFLTPATLFQIKDVMGFPTDFDLFPNPVKVERDEVIQSSFLRGHEVVRYDETYCIQLGVGCMGRCSYCGIRRAIGRVKSRARDRIVAELQQGLDEGYRRFYLTSDDVGCYGQDIGENIRKLLEDVFSIQADFKLVLKDFSPRWLIKYNLGELLIENSKKIGDLDLPIQSGSNRILGLMRRGYTAEEVEHNLKPICDVLPVTSQFIVGFPTETQEDFDASCSLVERLQLTDLLIYPYCERQGVDSEALVPKVLEAEIETRLVTLRNIKKILRCRRLLI